MIKPESLWALFKDCDNSAWLGDICRALGGQKDVKLDYGQRQMVRVIERDSGWMDRRVDDKREKDRERQRKWREEHPKNPAQKQETGVTRDKCDKQLSRVTDVTQTETADEHGKPKLAEVVNAAKTVMGVPEYYARWWYAEMKARGWLNTDGSSVGTHNWRPTLKAWFNIEKPKYLAEIREAASDAEKREIKVSAKDWTLCEERCANCANGKCAKGIRIPPELEKRPPEECKGFKPR